MQNESKPQEDALPGTECEINGTTYIRRLDGVWVKKGECLCGLAECPHCNGRDSIHL